MIEKVEGNGKVFALVMHANYEPNGVNFITSQYNPLQLGILKHQQGVRIKAHIHKNIPQTISEVQEVLHIEYGKVEAEFYEGTGEKIGSTILKSGDTILLLSGGHGFNILEDSKILEIKQGPYYGIKEDKEHLNVDRESEK